MSGTQRLLRRLAHLLDSARVPYMVTGSVASSIYGTPRSTQDIDVVIDPDRAGLLRFVESLSEDEFYFSKESAVGAFRRQGQFNIIDQKSGWKVDLIFRKPREINRVEFDRRSIETIDGVELFVARPEDVVLSKLEWARMGGSDRQIVDVAGILDQRGNSLDSDYIEEWVTELGLHEQLARAKAEAEQDE